MTDVNNERLFGGTGAPRKLSERTRGLAILRAFPWRLLGFGFYLIWGLHKYNIIQPFSLDFQSSTFSFVIYQAVSFVVLIACIALTKRHIHFFQREPLLWLCAFVALLGSLCGVFAALPGFGSFSMLLISGILETITRALLILQWYQLYASYPIRTVTIAISASYLLSVGAYFALDVFSGADLFVMAACNALFILLAIAPLVYSIRHQLPASTVMRDDDERAGSTLPPNDRIEQPENSLPDPLPGSPPVAPAEWSFPVRPVAAVTLYTLVFYCFSNFAQSIPAQNELGILFIAIAILVLGLFFFDRVDIGILCKIALLFMVAAFLAQIVLERYYPFLPGLLMNLGYTSVNIFIVIVFCNISFRYGIRAIWLFGIIQAACSAARLLGFTLSERVLAYSEPGGGASVQYIDGLAHPRPHSRLDAHHGR
jgi:hypothetical protein